MCTDTAFERYFYDRQEFTRLTLGLENINNALLHYFPAGKVKNSKAIHIAGTNGKGSTSYFIAQMLNNRGYKTVLFTSPHIHSVCERISVNLAPLSIDEFDALFHKALPTIERFNLSYFETTFFLAMLAAGDNNADYIILETGLGGRYDATNTDFIKEKIAVIASISQDHANILGSSIEEIIKNKIDIIKENNPVFIGYNEPYVVRCIREQLYNKELHIIDKNIPDDIAKLYAIPFSYNYLNAKQVVEYATGVTIEPSLLKLPMCRQEKMGRVILDGAHNPSAVLTLLKGLTVTPTALVISATGERDLQKLIRLFKRKINNIIVTTIPDNERSTTEETLKTLGYQYIKSPVEAVNTALRENDAVILVAGSLYLCAYVRSKILDGSICSD